MKRVLAGIGILALAGVAANAAPVVFSDDFDGATTWGNGRNNFDGLGVHPPDVGSYWTGGTLRNGTDAGFPAPAGNGGTFYADPYGRVDGFLTTADANATVDQLVRFTWDMYLTPQATGTYSGFEFITFDGGLGSGPRGTDFWLKADGTLLYYDETNNYTQVSAQDFTFATGQWVSVELVTNYATGAATLTIGSESHSFTVANPGSNRVDQLIFQNSSDSGNQSVFDNLVIEVIPEPASMGLIALGALGLLARRRA